MARSRPKSNDSKQAVTVVLVLFILLSLILAITSYLGYQDSAENFKARLAAEESQKAMRTEMNKLKLTVAIDHIAIGLPAPADAETFNGLGKSKEYQPTADAEFKLLKVVKWDPVMDRPETTLVKEIESLRTRIDNETKGLAKSETRAGEAKKEYETQLAGLRENLKTANDNLAKIKDDVEKRIKEIDTNYNATVKKFEESIAENLKAKEDVAKLDKAKRDVEAKLEAAMADAKLKIDKITEKIKQVEMTDFEQPKGKIVRVDTAGTSAYINLGSADAVKPQLTFSVFSPGGYKATAERKGSLEVVNVISDHLSMCRVTEQRAPTRDPILGGDQLFNPAWTPGLREHVAIAGLIDLTGDGRDGTLDFVKVLEKQGVIVDAYLDSRDIAIKGKGITRQTSYLIKGETPDFGGQENIREGDERQKKRMDVMGEVGTMIENANKLGVTTVTARRYMALMGIKLPRTPASATDWNTYTFKPTAAAPAGGAAAPAAGEPKMDKDKMEKMDKDKMEKKEKMEK